MASQREIKFRVYNKQVKKIENLRMLEDFSCMYVQENLDTIMQFTGLKDKNGKEIYESDLVRRPADGFEPREIMKVVWGESAWGVEYLDGKSAPSLSTWKIYDNYNLEIIGNIYENPELLK